MVRWGMVIDLTKCAGCQTCTVACKVENALGPRIQRVTVVEKEIGTFPNVTRLYIPKRCMNCKDPQCVEVCPSGATEQREDGIVVINTDDCIGCRYCMMACPYNARMFRGVERSYFDTPSKWERQRYPEHDVGVVDKCDFCAERVDQGLANGLKPGDDLDATPFCVFACISNAMYFGDLDDSDSKVSQLIKERGGFQLLPEMETDPSVYYLPRRQGDDEENTDE